MIQKLGFFPSSHACVTGYSIQVLAGQGFSPDQYTPLPKHLHSSQAVDMERGFCLLMVVMVSILCGCVVVVVQQLLTVLLH